MAMTKYIYALIGFALLLAFVFGYFYLFWGLDQFIILFIIFTLFSLVLRIDELDKKIDRLTSIIEKWDKKHLS